MCKSLTNVLSFREMDFAGISAFLIQTWRFKWSLSFFPHSLGFKRCLFYILISLHMLKIWGCIISFLQGNVLFRRWCLWEAWYGVRFCHHSRRCFKWSLVFMFLIHSWVSSGFCVMSLWPFRIKSQGTFSLVGGFHFVGVPFGK